ncbi:MAG: hypothetical protein ACTSVV_15295 [Promethearchaeota archaeon]
MSNENEIIDKILKFLKEKQPLTKTNIHKKLKVPSNKVQKYLKDLVNKKVLTSFKRGNGTYYHFKDFIPKEQKKGKKTRAKIKNDLSEEIWIKIKNEIRLEISNFLHPYIKKIDYLWENKQIREKKPININDFKLKLKRIYDVINKNNIYGGMVPIPKIKQELKRSEIIISDELINKYLKELEKNDLINLIVASDPTLLEDKELGINNTKRGLLYFLKWK